MADWNPALYRRFEDERTRPARDLLARVPLTAPARVFDLGCGPGNSTELLAERFAGADVVGIDNSPAMLEAARKRLPGARFELADLKDWAPGAAPDLIYSNATLHWLPGHGTLIPRLFSLLAPGGVLAVQMPDNLAEPSHRAMAEVAALPQFAAAASAGDARAEILAAGGYYDLLAPMAAATEVWRTVYEHPMASPAAIVDWLRSTGLRPHLDALADDAARAAYLSEFERRMDAAYPARADGRRLLAFPRIFFVASKPA